MAAKNKGRNQETILFILMGLIIVGLVISGYFLFVKKILPELASEKQEHKISENPNQASEAQNATSVFIPDDEAQMLTLYFPQKGKDHFRAEIRKVRQKKMLTAQARQIVEELLRGPERSDLYSPFPTNTSLRGLFFEAGVFIVDLSREFSNSKAYGAVEETLALYSVVNSLTELDPKGRVKILVNGSEQTEENGHIDLSGFLSRLPELIVE